MCGAGHSGARRVRCRPFAKEMLVPKSLSFTAALFAATAPIAVAAQDAPILVSAARADDPQQPGENGSAATVLTADRLETRQVRDVAEVLRDVPGVAIGQVPGQVQLRLRGSEANQVLVLVDGIEVSDPFAGEFDFTTLQADIGGSVEVLRGPQSALYGSDAIGGVVGYRTASGRERAGLSAYVEGGSFGTANAGARIGGVAGAFDYALTGTLVTRDGAPNARDGKRRLGREAGALAAKLGAALGGDWRAEGVLRYATGGGDYNETGFDPAAPTFGLVVDTPGLRYTNEATYGLAALSGSVLGGAWSHRIEGQFADIRRDTFRDDARDSGQEGSRLKGSYVTSLALATGAVSHRLTGAVDVEEERFRNTDPSGFAFSGERSVANTGLVAQYDGAWGDTARLSAAVRRDWNDLFADATTWRIGASWQVVPAIRLRGAAGAGIKNPGFYELYGFVDGRFIGNPDLAPERSESWEIGADLTLAGDAIRLGATYFDARLEGEIVTTYPAPAFVATPANSDAVSYREGLELTAAARLGEGFALDAAYTLLDAEEGGLEEVRRPRHSGSLVLSWQPAARPFGANVAIRRVGDSTDLAFTDPSYVPVRATLDGYTLVQLAADWEVSDRLQLYGRVENALDERYEQVFSFVSPGRSAVIGARLTL